MVLIEKTGVRTLPSSMLKGVVLGANISPENQEWITSIVRKRGGVSLFKAEFCETSFAINNVLLT